MQLTEALQMVFLFFRVRKLSGFVLWNEKKGRSVHVSCSSLLWLMRYGCQVLQILRAVAVILKLYIYFCSVYFY